MLLMLFLRRHDDQIEMIYAYACGWVELARQFRSPNDHSVTVVMHNPYPSTRATLH